MYSKKVKKMISIKITTKNGRHWTVGNIPEESFKEFAKKIDPDCTFMVFNDLLLRTDDIESIEQIKK